MALFSTSGFILTTCMLLTSPQGGLAKRGGFLKLQLLCYQNPGHLNLNGIMCDYIVSKQCDPYFTICISNRPIIDDSLLSCPVFYKQTDPYKDKEFVCDTPSDNIDLPEIELPKPLQDEYYVRIKVTDDNYYHSHEVIATFFARYDGQPSANFGQFVNTEIIMSREEKRIRNPNAQLKISIGLKCDYDLYGKVCGDFCRADVSDSFSCSEHGVIICKPGWKGSHCKAKDLCFNFPCAADAQCIELNNSPKCTCNGIIGPECYPNYNPCKPNPCQNDGKCLQRVLPNRMVNCTCRSLFYGPRCEYKFNPCQISPCLKGTCIISKNETHTCQCHEGQNRITCTLTSSSHNYNNITNGTVPISAIKMEKQLNIGVLVGVITVLIIFATAIAGIIIFIRRKNKKKDRRNEKEKNGLGDIRLRELPECISNNYVTCNDDCQYDTIDERATYIYQIEDNDDYLVPSRPITPTTSPSGKSDNSGYMAMYNNNNIYTHDPLTDENTKENEDIPSLPTRTIKKKMFNFFRIPKQ